MKQVKKVIVTLRKIDYITVELSEDTGYDLPDTVLGFHDLFTQIKTNPEHFITSVDIAETEVIIDSIEVEEG